MDCKKTALALGQIINIPNEENRDAEGRTTGAFESEFFLKLPLQEPLWEASLLRMRRYFNDS